MRREDFFNLIITRCALEDKESITPETQTKITQWDSLDVITLLSLFKQYCNMTVSIDTLEQCNSFNDILDLAGNKYEN